MSKIDFKDLRAANIARDIEWGQGQTFGLSYRGNELAGETGEACNVLKKLDRERMGLAGSRDTVEHAAEELADVIICADLAAMELGIDLAAAVARKFNKTTDKYGLKTKLHEDQP
jgi:NTP pyrophosphatase (non-canonical NTP hydrolase)